MTLTHRIEAAEGADRALDLEIALLVGTKARNGSINIAFHYTASVDAALTLVPEGWSIGLGDLRGYDPIIWRAHLRDHNDPNANSRAWVEGHAATPALALCAAALRAKESMTMA